MSFSITLCSIDLRQGLLVMWKLIIFRPAGKPLSSQDVPSSVPNAGVMDMHRHAQLFTWGLEIQTQVLLKHSYPLSNFPSPSTLRFEPGSPIVPTAQQIARLMYSKSLRDSGFCFLSLGIQCMCQCV